MCVWASGCVRRVCVHVCVLQLTCFFVPSFQCLRSSQTFGLRFLVAIASYPCLYSSPQVCHDFSFGCEVHFNIRFGHLSSVIWFTCSNYISQLLPFYFSIYIFSISISLLMSIFLSLSSCEISKFLCQKSIFVDNSLFL